MPEALSRSDLLRLASRPGPFDEVVDAVVAYAECRRDVLLEHVGDDRWRWSPAHAGGPHPLIRISEIFLGLPKLSVYIQFETIAGHAVLVPEEKQPSRGTAVRIIEVGPTTTRSTIEVALLALAEPEVFLEAFDQERDAGGE